MAKGYRAVERDQVFLFPPSMRDWLPGDHPVWLVISVVEEHLDTSVFHALRKTGGAGTAGYDPDMLLTVLVWAYAHRETSSRRIERLCQTDVAFRVICGGNLPDHVTIARFRKDFPGAAGEFFGQVLVLCARLGMGRLGVVALDGMKIAASASKSANRTEDTLRELAAQAAARHAAADAAEDELFGAGQRGDELPAGGDWSPKRRAERIAAALADLEAGRAQAGAEQEAKAARFRARREAGQLAGRPPASAEVALAQEKLEQARAARSAQLDELAARHAGLAAAGRRPHHGATAGVEDYHLVRRAAARVRKARARAARRAARAARQPQPVRNITDPHSRLMPVRGGFIQGYNTQNLTSSDGLIIATCLTQDPTDCAWLEPMLAQARHAATLIATHQPARDGDEQQHQQVQGTAGQPVGLILADAGYLSGHNLTLDGPDRLIATGRRRDLETAARHDSTAAGGSGGEASHDDPAGGAAAAMAARLQTPEGIAAYRQRGHIAETPHGHIKHNLGFRQLTMRGKPKAAAEWTFVATVHNLFKAITAGHLTPQALTELATQPG